MGHDAFTVIGFCTVNIAIYEGLKALGSAMLSSKRRTRAPKARGVRSKPLMGGGVPPPETARTGGEAGPDGRRRRTPPPIASGQRPPASGGTSGPPCSPPLDCPHEELVAFIKSMKGGERVMEMGESGMKGQCGTVEIREGRVCIRWDTTFDQPGQMVTSFTGGARLIGEANKAIS